MLPVADGIVDVILSNCVINLCEDKGVVFQEAARALRQRWPAGDQRHGDGRLIPVRFPIPTRITGARASLVRCQKPNTWISDPPGRLR